MEHIMIIWFFICSASVLQLFFNCSLRVEVRICGCFTHSLVFFSVFYMVYWLLCLKVLTCFVHMFYMCSTTVLYIPLMSILIVTVVVNGFI
jgi:hypothetical protein